MPRLQRIHVPGGLYYVTHQRDSTRAIFESEDDYVRFEQIFSRALEQFDVRAHAFCWSPEAIYLALQVSTTSLGRFMQAIASRYAKYLNFSKSRSPLFRRRYYALLVDMKYLPQLVRYIHRCACSTPDAIPYADFPWSSHRAYLRKTPLPWLTTHATLQMFAHHTDAAISRYVDFMNEVAITHPKDFAKHGCHDPRIVGDALFMVTLPRNLPIDRTTRTLEDIILSVLLQQGIERDELITTKVTRAGALARALVTYHAVERNIATYTEVAHALTRSIPTLQAGVRRYRESPEHAKLFRIDALRSPGPIAELPLTSKPWRSAG